MNTENQSFPQEHGRDSKSTCSGQDMPIAIIGMSCRFPGSATNPEALWRLCEEGRSAWSKIPRDRFNSDAFYHPCGERTTTTNVTGGHFLEEDIGLFDATFFNMTPEVSAEMDPQCRLQLESVYEALENSGITIENIAGSRTAVFSGAFYKDYMDSLMRDPEELPRYVMTGNGTTMLSNRISHFYDLRGPSMTIDTGCSTGLVALHQACQSLKSQDASVAIVVGANIMINPDIFVLWSSLGFLSPDGRCYSFDSRASGYGRGEGVAALILKPLHEAIHDGDPIRAVISQTTVNQDGKTPTITSPSQEAQEDLMRLCYKQANLDPGETAYVEAHGTGTKAGDPTEAGAIHAVFCRDRQRPHPLYMGSVKSNIGHLEPASGLAAIIKVALALQKGVIPPSINFEHGNASIPFEQWSLKIPRKLEPWPRNSARRASINNFGYGGANAHVIIEAWKPDDTIPVDATLTQTSLESSAYSLNISTPPSPLEDDEDCFDQEKTVSLNTLTSISSIGPISTSSAKSRVLLLSAKDKEVAVVMLSRLKDYVKHSTLADEELIDRLAHTLDHHRSRFSWRVSFLSSTTKAGLVAKLEDSTLLTPIRSTRIPRLGFVFTGQGAQWYAMGRELIEVYPVFSATLQEADKHLQDMNSSWSLVDELTRDEVNSKVNDVVLSPPLCIAVQIGLVRLLASWNIRPTAITSHSSGEVAAAYAAGLIDLREAMAIVFTRGAFLQSMQENVHYHGAMIAVGMGRDAAESFMEQMGTTGKTVVACVNSPSSVTISGDQSAIAILERQLQQDKVFVRALNVPVAYHSHHMNSVAGDYLAVLQGSLRKERNFKKVHYTSPVTGYPVIDPSTIGAEHWVKNMVQPVLFVDSLSTMCVSPDGQQLVDSVIEVGAHGALSGPIRQTLKLSHLKDLPITYSSCLWRGKDAVATMQDLAGSLITQGYPVDLKAVNFPTQVATLRALGDLPSYPWNHRTRYWHEPRINRAHRNKQLPTHDLLGVRLLGSNPKTPTWKHFIRPSELPWVMDHQVQSDIIYPAAGMLCMAMEAMRQVGFAEGRSFTSLKFRNIDFLRALIVPNTERGIEVQVVLLDGDDKTLGLTGWKTFTITSVQNDGTWGEHCGGLIGFETKRRGASDVSFTLDHDPSMTSEDAQSIFSHLRSLGIFHGESFRNVYSSKMTGPRKSIASIVVPDSATLMPLGYQHDHLIHPTTLDSIIVAAYTSLPAHGTLLKSGMVPRYIKSMSVSCSVNRSPGDVLQAQATLLDTDDQGFHASLSVRGSSSAEAVIVIDDLHCISIGTPTSQEENPRNRCLQIEWVEDFAFVPTATWFDRLRAMPDPEESAIAQELDQACFYYFYQTVALLTQSDVQNLLWYHRLYYNWMEAQIVQHRMAVDWLKVNASDRQSLLSHVAKRSTSGAMVCRVGENLAQILRQQITPLELMVEDQLLYRYYQEALHIGSSYRQVYQIIDLFAHKNPKARILEIGAGTGGCTSHVIRALGGGDTNREARFSRYDFTDVSVSFFDEAKNRFSVWGDLIDYRKLDVEKDPVSQGYEEGHYDLVVACQVLHATTNMDSTMTNVRRLLKPGGKLVLVETTQDSHDIQLIFGVLPDWWLSKEPERKQSPSLTPALWNIVLVRNGFSGLDLCVKDCEDESKYVMNVIVSTASGNVERQAPENLFVVCARPEQIPLGWLDRLFDEIRSNTSFYPILSDMESVRSKESLCIFLDSVSSSLLASPDLCEFECIRRLVTEARGLMWLSYGGTMDCENPISALHSGFLRTLRSEYTNKRYISLDLEYHNANPFTIPAANVVAQVLGTSLDFTRAKNKVDFEYAFRNDAVFIPRVCVDKEKTKFLLTNQSLVSELRPFHQSGRECQLETIKPGMLDSLTFVDVSHAYEELPDGFVEIAPRAFGLNFRDIMVAMGQLRTNIMGFECSGVVTKVSANVTAEHGLVVGDRVCALLRGHWATHTRVHWTSVAKIPSSMSFESAASIPIVYVTAYYSLHQLAKIQKGETILIHSAAGGVGQAAIQFAQLAGAKIFATVGSAEKEELIVEKYGIPREQIFSSRDVSFSQRIRQITGGIGVDVILNSLAGDLLHETWTCIAPFGRFVEIGKRDFEQNNSLQMEPFVRAASFFAVDLFQLGALKQQTTMNALQSVMSLFDAGHLRPIAPISVYPISQLEKAFRIMQAGKHLGKIVVVPDPNDLVMKQKVPIRLSSKATYVVVGGLGGIGKSIIRRLLDLGARHIAILSRNAEGSQHQTFLKELAVTGANITPVNVDVSDASALRTAVTSIENISPPVKGVIQAAMVLQDAIIENMTWNDYMAATQPKVQGTWNLHTQFRHVDFFIILSSLVGIAGNASQANYAAGGSYEDAIARYRSARGLSAVCLDIGMIGGVGYVARTGGVQDRLAKKGFQLISEAEVLDLVQDSIVSPRRSPSKSQVIMGVTNELRAANYDDSPYLADVRFAGLEQTTAMIAGNTTTEQNGLTLQNVTNGLKTAHSWDHAVDCVLRAIIGKLCDMFGLQADEVDPKVSMAHYGVDSLVAVELRNWLSSASHCDMSIFDIMQSKSLESLSEVACTRSRLVPGTLKPIL